MKRNLCALIAAVTALLACTFAASAQALPAGFWGVVPQSGLSLEKFERLKRGGVESVRIPVVWNALQGSEGADFHWGTIDVQVEAATKAGIKVLPFLAGAPEWVVPSVVVPGTGGIKAVSRLPITGAARTGWVDFIGRAVARYGPAGSFWSEHPELTRRPIRIWQVWNEPNFKYFNAKPSPGEYGKLVKISSIALTAADPGAKVVLAGLFARPKGARDPRTGKHKSLNWYASDFVSQMYKLTPGLKTKYF